MVTLIELALIGIWGAAVAMQGRRLLRLAQTHQGWHRNQLRSGLSRAWFWLGREEFWNTARHDSAYCLQLTLMLFALAWFT